MHTDKQETGKFVIRVYGILTNSNKEVLLSDEYRFGMMMTKFPGGGLKFGEGPEDCLRREAMEELGQSVKIIEHFYTTGFYQKAMFFEDHQLLSIYYRIEPEDKVQFRISERPFDFPEKTGGSISFRWKNINKLNPDELTFPVDRHVAGLLKKEYLRNNF
ncbi:MAG: NUDIX domain-containing protein [Marinilabiliales bacterium]|nr:MAG: NUDIX domain-containing protein [Marinilabiliales bacterium]